MLIFDPAKLGISMVVSIVLLIGGVMALANENPKLSIDENQALPLASESAVPSAANDSDVSIESADAGNTADTVAKQTSTSDNDKMEVEVMTADLAAFDPITSGDWSLDNLSDYALEITQ